MFLTALAIGLLWDRIIGEPRRLHPLVLFGRWALWLEARFDTACAHGLFATPLQQRLAGVIAFTAALIPPLGFYLSILALLPAALRPIWEGLALGLALGGRSLAEHLDAVIKPLQAGDLAAARSAVQRIVSRNAEALDKAGVALAATESTAENGHDAILASLFWFALGGGTLALLHRLCNTLDAMWGYRHGKYRYFGTAAARADDLLGYPSARFTALGYALCSGAPLRVLRQAYREAPLWPSPNAGIVLAAAAAALGVRLGGDAFYHGARCVRPQLNPLAPQPDAETLPQALALVRCSARLATLFAIALILLIHGA